MALCLARTSAARVQCPQVSCCHPPCPGLCSPCGITRVMLLNELLGFSLKTWWLVTLLIPEISRELILTTSILFRHPNIYLMFCPVPSPGKGEVPSNYDFLFVAWCFYKSTTLFFKPKLHLFGCHGWVYIYCFLQTWVYMYVCMCMYKTKLIYKKSRHVC